MKGTNSRPDYLLTSTSSGSFVLIYSSNQIFDSNIHPYKAASVLQVALLKILMKIMMLVHLITLLLAIFVQKNAVSSCNVCTAETVHSSNVV